nr:unnamed protein product [Digitaria exilis]
MEKACAVQEVAPCGICSLLSLSVVSHGGTTSGSVGPRRRGEASVSGGTSLLASSPPARGGRLPGAIGRWGSRRLAECGWGQRWATEMGSARAAEGRPCEVRVM